MNPDDEWQGLRGAFWKIEVKLLARMPFFNVGKIFE
jgi:hypothetical protein